MKSNNLIKMIIPSWINIEINSWEDIEFLGKNNVIILLQYKENKIYSIEHEIKKLEEFILLLEGKSRLSLSKEAKRYQDPKIPRKSLIIKDNSWSKELEPSRAIDINRKSGSTTFNNCGWCKYAGGGSCRYSYYISTICSFFSYANKKVEETGVSTVGCLLRKLSKEDIAELVKAYQKKIKGLERKKELETRLLNRLSSLAKRLEEKPYLSDLRPHDHFNVDDEIVFFIDTKEEKMIRQGFIKAKVIYGYRHHDGCVSSIAQKVMHLNNDYHGGKGLSAGASRGDVMLLSEFKYLKSNPDFAKVWVKSLKAKKYSAAFGKKLFSKKNRGIYLNGRKIPSISIAGKKMLNDLEDMKKRR